jgi:hypothetical protein
VRAGVAAVASALTALMTMACLVARGAEQAAPPTVSCDQIIGRAASGGAGRHRVVLGVVSVPPGYLRQVESVHVGPWRSWRKAGLVVRANAPPVVVSVPRAWRTRAAITWGDSAIVGALRIAPCSAFPSKAWNAYAGGFYLRSGSACVPLVVRVGQRRETVRFGLGRRC